MKKTKSSKKSPPSLQGKERIIDAAIPLFADKGLDGTTTRDIAQASGLNISLISYYFGGKEELYKHILLQHVQNAQLRVHEVLSFIQSVPMTSENFQKLLRMLIQSIIEQKSRHSEIERMIHRELTSGLPHAKDVFEETMTRVGDRMAEVFAHAQEAGVLRKDLEPRILLLHIVHMIEGYLTIQRCSTRWSKKIFQLPRDTEKLSNHIITLFLYGIFTSKKDTLK